MGLRVKICGITRPEQGQAIAAMGATALGFICAGTSPRYVTPAQIGAIVTELPLTPDSSRPACSCIGVFVNASLEVIAQTVAIGQLTGVQLHGNESPEFCQQVRDRLPGIEIIKALRIKSASALQQAALYQDWVDTLLLDADHPTLAGGTGQTLDWAILQSFRPTCSWLLAGGLTPDNVLLALQQAHPDGIDLSSSVEYSPGNKNLKEVARLFDRLRTNCL